MCPSCAYSLNSTMCWGARQRRYVARRAPELARHQCNSGQSALVAEHLALPVNLLSPSANAEARRPGNQPSHRPHGSSSHINRLSSRVNAGLSRRCDMGGTYDGHYAMNDTARRLRAQKAYSTEPAYLERMAREEEARRVDPSSDVAAEGGSALAHREANVIGRNGARDR